MRYKLLFFFAVFLCVTFISPTASADDVLVIISEFNSENSSEGAFLSASIATDTSDYAPGDSVIITGGGFWPGETVEIDITNKYNPGFGDAVPWTVIADGSGNIETYWIVPTDGVDQTYTLTADGLSSGIHAEAEFTDANTKLRFSVTPPDEVCAGTEIEVCAYLRENCGGGNYAPLPNRPILFFFNLDNCGANVGQNADDTVYTNENGIACITFTTPTTPGNYSIRLKFLGEDKPSSSEDPNSACDPSKRTKLSASNRCDSYEVVTTGGNAPIVNLSDSSVVLCGEGEVCLPVEINDADCDVDSVYSNLGQYSGSENGLDQIAVLNHLGATITQIGGGAPGAVLTESGDFVPPINALSGVSVTLPNFIFAANVEDYGSFPSGVGPAQSADQLLGSPTDMTFTLPGAGGPDGGSGDGSVDFSSGNYVSLGFAQDVKTCDGSPVDLIIFTNTSGSGDAELTFIDNNTPVHVITQFFYGGSAGSGDGGITVDIPDGIEFDEIEITCVSGNLEIDAVAARTDPSPSADDICFTADTAGVYTVIVSATDACNNIGADTAYITVSLGNPPVADAGTDFSEFLCTYGQICFGVSFSDPDNDLALTELVSPIGTLTGNQICFTPSYEGVYSFIIHAVDSCGSEDFDTVLVTIGLNDAPIATQPDTIEATLCVTEELCDTLSATDANGGTLTWSLISGVGSVTPSGVICFTPGSGGYFDAVVAVTDSCGAADTITVSYNININSAPVATDTPLPLDFFLCTSSEICTQFMASDADLDSLTWTLLSGSGSLSSSGEYCFTPTGDGTYIITVEVSDPCGAADTTTKTYNITINNPPVVTLGNDTAYSLCATDQICLDYTVSDVEGNTLTESMVAGFGTIDTAANQICFTPGASGSYQFIVSATDSCGAIGKDTINIDVTIGQSASITCPEGPVDINLCAADSICYMLGISPASATVSTSIGSYNSGELCFFADTSGTYIVDVIAEESCGSDTCQIQFNVTIGSAATVNCPPAQNIFLCEADSICIPVGINGSNVSVTVSPIGIYQSGSICFPADTSGHYEISIVASTSCGSDSCTLVADVVINDAPVADVPPASIDTFICADASICYQFSATDANGGSLTWNKLSGVGTVSSSGEFCFNSAGSGSYDVTAVVTDSCGAADTVSLTYNVTLNTNPTIALGNDLTFSLCQGQSVCFPYTVSDVDDNLASITITEGNGVVDTLNEEICFYPNTSGVYQFIVEAEDLCGAVDSDTINVTINFNSAPVVNAGANQNLFLCAPEEICWNVSATDVDGNLLSFEMTEGTGTFDGSQICFTPTEDFCYEFILQATDSCSASSVDTVIICVDFNEAPVADAGTDQSIFQCTPAEICLPASCSDADGNLTTCELLTANGSYDGSNICFTPDTSGLYSFEIKATDDCGLTDYDTVSVTVDINEAPVCSVPNDTIISQCTIAQVCLPVSATDANGNLSFCQIISGPGTISGGNWCYTPTSSQVVNVTVRCEDDCGAFCESSFTVEFRINSSPTVEFENLPTQNLCEPAEICVGYTLDDPDDPQGRVITLLSANGSLDTTNHEVCFTPTASGTYTFILGVTDDCGANDVDTVDINVNLNSVPVVDLGADQMIDLCVSEEICIPVTVSDINNNIISTTLTGPGTYSSSEICFTPTASGAYQFILEVEDACGAVTVDTLNIDVTLNAAPTIAFGADINQQLCTPTEICVPYSVSDPDGPAGLIEDMFSGFGAIDTLNNEICFTPTTAGTYEFIVSVTDSCGATAYDTTNVTVTFGDLASISCPASPIDISLCAPDQICQSIAISPVDATVSTSFGTYTGGELCFDADTSGTYNVTIIADSDCGADTCEVTFNVTIGSAASIGCPAPQSVFLCESDSICVPVSVNGSGVSVSVSPFGTYSAGTVCFPADTSGLYQITVIASTSCGSDTCTFEVDVTKNNIPVAVDPPTPVDTFICTAGQICYQFDASDADGGSLSWSRLSGNGTVSSSGEWCFNASGNNSYSVTAVVADSCGAADTVMMTYNVSQNSAPVVTLGNDFTAPICDSSEICLPYTTSDADNNISLEELLVGSGAIDTTNNTICFIPDTAGVYVHIVRVTDACGLVDADTIAVTIPNNEPPTIFAGDDQSYDLCDVVEICWGISATDPNNNITSVYMISPVGTYNANTICFTPDTAGVYTFIIGVDDSCGETDVDTVLVTVDINSEPICEVPNDTTIFQCAPTEISLQIGATDVDGNFDHCEILAGPGSIVNGNWVFTPSSNQDLLIKVMCLDSCGAACIDSFNVSVEMNSAPVVSGGDDFTEFLCDISEICFPVTYSDVNNNLDSVQLITSNGSLDLGSNEVCFTPTDTNDGTYTFILRAVDVCGLESYDTVYVDVEFNSPPTLDPPPSFVVYLDEPGEICFAVNSDDPDGNFDNVVVSSPGTYNPLTDEVCFTADSSGEYCLTLTASDDCGNNKSSSVYDICITVQIDDCFLVQIEKTHNAIQGQFETVNIYYDGSSKQIGGFDLLLAYEQTALTVGEVRPGEIFTNCGWEYFTYRFGPDGNCGSGCPSGILRVIGIAETNNGGYHPSCFLTNAIGDLVQIDFLVTNDRTLECQYAPVEFFWMDCGDNTLSSVLGDTLWMSRDIYSFEYNNITNNNYGFPGFYGAHEDCMIGGGAPGKMPIRCVDFTNGGVDIVCADSIDAVGDINLNEVSYEIADAVLFSNYFVYGLSVFTVNVDGQVAASDVNKDGIPLSVADLVYLIRVIVGDAPQYAKPAPGYEPTAEFTLQSGMLSVASTTEKIGAISFVIEGNVKPELTEQSKHMDLRYNFDGEHTRAIVFALDGQSYLSEGEILKIASAGEIEEISVGSFDGLLMNAKLDNLPERFELHQNYPNPFNPTTKIRFSLPVKAEYELVIYNVLGQTVERFEKNSDAGYIEIEWDASKYASGVYFYRLRAGSFSDTKKMVLLK